MLKKISLLSFILIATATNQSNGNEFSTSNSCKQHHDMCIKNCEMDYGLDNLKGLKKCLDFCGKRYVDCLEGASLDQFENQ